MKNRIINIAIEQITSDNMNQMFMQQAFFKEYFKMFRNNKIFDKDFIKYINENIDINNVINISNTLINLFENKLNILSGKGIENEIGLIIFIGDGRIDGHSIILDDSVYVFVDLVAVISRSNLKFDLDSFLSHEIIHAIHYKVNKEFYYKDYSIFEDIYLKTLIVEGMATYISMIIFGLSENLGYWLGILKSDEIEQWENNCIKLKKCIGVRLKEAISNKKYDNSLYVRLFCIKKCEKITLYRMGYYYGSEIIKNVHYNNSVNQLFKLKFKDFGNYINEYFETAIV